MSRDQSWTLTAQWIFPVDGLPLERGTITIAGERIIGIEPHGTRTADRDLGNVAIIPGLVNAHTHLDLGGLRGQVAPGADFPHWLRAVIGHRREQTLQQVHAGIDQGLAESVHYGTTLLGDISAGGASWKELSEHFPGRAVVFYELIGLPRTRARDAWKTAEAWLSNRRATECCRPGLSPHAPYSVRKTLFQVAAERAARDKLPVAIHLAETQAELELLEDGSGPFVDFLNDLGVWDSRGLVKGVEQLFKINQDLPHLLIAHGNYLCPSAVPRNATVVYCPRTHTAFGRTEYPLRDFLGAGVRVALGTDSLASSPDLNVLAEARFVHDSFPEIPGETILRMATLAGAEALGWDKETGSLVPGKSADLVVLPLSNDAAENPYELLWKTAPLVRGVLVRGAWVENDPHLEVPR